MTPSIARLNVTNSDTSLAIISASTRMAVLICVNTLVGEQTRQNFFSKPSVRWSSACR